VANDKTYSLSQISSVNLGRKPIGCVAIVLCIVGTMILLGGIITTGAYLTIAIELGEEGGAVIAMMIGAVFLLIGGGTGLGMLIGGIKLAQKNRHTYVVRVTTATSEMVGLEYREQETATTVLQALNQALADRE